MKNKFSLTAMNQLLNPADVADLLGIKVETLQIWRCNHRYDLPYVKIGGRIRYKISDVEKFIESRTMRNDNII
ncbi:MAG: helix-turn-helix domain-containing protein [Gammaproteobacteria bacterium]|jgi:predicted site-specific integrase-resolvase